MTQRSYRLHWLLPDYPHTLSPQKLTLKTPKGPYSIACAGTRIIDSSLVRAAPESPRGWTCPFYYAKEPALSLALEGSFKKGGFFTVFSPQNFKLDKTKKSLRLTLKDKTYSIGINRYGQICQVEVEKP